MRNIDKLKGYLKDAAETIRETRSGLKASQRGKGKEPTWKLEGRLSSLTYDYRHHHIAYSELRGRTREQIEGKVRDNNGANESYIRSIKEMYAWSEEEIAWYNERMEKNEA